METTVRFNRDGGKPGETALYDYLLWCGYKDTDIQDVSRVRKYQKQDIDFLVDDESESLKLEAKYDNYKRYTGNTMIEVTSNVESKKSGCAFVCKADFIITYQRSTHHLIAMDRKKLYAFMIRNIFRYKTYTQFTPFENRSGGYHSRAMAIPIKHLLDAGVIVDIISTDDDYQSVLANN